MQEVIIKYNPYKQMVEFYDEASLLNNEVFARVQNNRIQTLLGEIGKNWRGLLPELRAVFTTGAIHVTFVGRDIDFEDVKNALAVDRDINVTSEILRNESDITGDLDRVFGKIAAQGRSEFNTQDENGNTLFTRYEASKNGIFDINVIATMSSGKSTLINALLGQSLLPSRNDATTARIVNILDNDTLAAYRGSYTLVDGEKVELSEINFTTIDQLNDDDQIAQIDLEGNIPTIDSDKVRLQLVDTPGPNNSRNMDHFEMTNRIIENQNSVVLYVMNYTQFGINDDAKLLKQIAGVIARKKKEAKDRFIFVLNKVDTLDVEKDKSVGDFIAKVNDYLADQFAIKDAIIVPVSAQLALNIRKSKTDQGLSAREKRDLTGDVGYFIDEPGMHLNEFAQVPTTVKQSVQARINATDDEFEQALIYSGVPVLEELIKEFVNKYAYPIKIHDAVNDALVIINEQIMENDLQKRVSGDANYLVEVQQQIDDAQQKYEDGKENQATFRDEIAELTINDTQDILEDCQFEVESKLAEVSYKYESLNEIKDRGQAQYWIAKFEDDLNDFAETIQIDLNTKLKTEVYQRCEEILEDYQTSLQSILDNVNMGNYDFSQNAQVRKMVSLNIDKMVNEATETKTRKVSYMADNPEREGFWGSLKFWKPKKISKSYDEQYEVINISKIIVDQLGTFKSGIDQKIEEMVKDTDIQMNDYKAFFIEKLDEFDVTFQGIFDDLREKMASMDDVEERLAANQAFIAEITDIKAELDAIINF